MEIFTKTEQMKSTYRFLLGLQQEIISSYPNKLIFDKSTNLIIFCCKDKIKLQISTFT